MTDNDHTNVLECLAFYKSDSIKATRTKFSFLKMFFIGFIVMFLFWAAWPNKENFVAAAPNAVSLKWEFQQRGTIIDVDPYSGGRLYELQQDNGKYGWCQFSNEQANDAKPARGEYGAFYYAKTKKGVVVKWVAEKEPTQKISPKTKKAVLNPPTPKSFWEFVSTKLPPADKTVLVKYQNDITITTAYINRQNEWRLETDRERIGGGREITTIKEWREIPK